MNDANATPQQRVNRVASSRGESQSRGGVGS